MPFSTDDPSVQELLARNASFDLPEGAPNPLSVGKPQTLADAPKFQDPMVPFFQPQQASQPGGIRRMFSGMLAGMADAALKESTGMNSVERQMAQLEMQQKQQQLRFGPMEMQAKLNAMTAQPRFDPNTGAFVGVMNDAQFQQYVRGSAAAGVNAASRERTANINQQGQNERNNANIQSKEKLTAEQIASREKIAGENLKWANYYKGLNASLAQQRMALAGQRADFQMNGPTANIRTQGQMAGQLQQHVPTIAAQIADLGQKGKLGPMAGRFNELMAGKWGNGDPDYVALRTNLGLFQTALMKAHVGARGSEMIMKHFQDLIDSGKMSPESLQSSLGVINDYLETYKQGAQYGQGSNTPPPGAKVRDFSHLIK